MTESANTQKSYSPQGNGRASLEWSQPLIADNLYKSLKNIGYSAGESDHIVEAVAPHIFYIIQTMESYKVIADSHSREAFETKALLRNLVVTLYMDHPNAKDVVCLSLYEKAKKYLGL